MPHIFLSYSRKDISLMARVRADLRAEGLEVWTDEGIKPGTPSWKRAIEDAIKNAGCLICILSPDAAQSRWVREELDFAEGQGKQIYLLMARGDKNEAVPFGFSTHQWVDIRYDYEALGNQLIPAICEYLGVDCTSQVLKRSAHELADDSKIEIKKVNLAASEQAASGKRNNERKMTGLLIYEEFKDGTLTMNVMGRGGGFYGKLMRDDFKSNAWRTQSYETSSVADKPNRNWFYIKDFVAKIDALTAKGTSGQNIGLDNHEDRGEWGEASSEKFRQDQINAINRLRLVQGDITKIEIWNVRQAMLDEMIQLNLLREAKLVGINLAGAKLTNADMQRARLGSANLERANLSHTSLQGAYLDNARMEAVDMNGTDLRGANMNNAYLRGANVWTGRGILSVKFDETTVLPDGNRWTFDNDILRFIDPKDPDYWQLAVGCTVAAPIAHCTVRPIFAV